MKLIYWFYLLIASGFEILWVYSLKYLDLKKVVSIPFKQLFLSSQSKSLIPLLGYIVFGLCNIVFFSLAMKQIPASIAFAAWMGATLVGIKIADAFVFSEAVRPIDAFYVLLILAGIIGLKTNA